MPKTQPPPMRVISEDIPISGKQREGRATNVIAELLMAKLLVPKIFLKPRTLKIFLKPDLNQNAKPFLTIDVLAIDRAGSGDIHAVHIFLDQTKDLREQIKLATHVQFLLSYIPVHFKYIAVDSQSIDFVSKQQLFAKDGIGRVGIIEVKEIKSGPPEARIVIQPERFRVNPDAIKEFDKFQNRARADMEFRS
ncbi:MAG TPA: hypothetical protein VFN53_11515 [Acidobacteriaceae bacterium]|nr:hypothetical protein [Acidobacteriaceae bacterium]